MNMMISYQELVRTFLREKNGEMIITHGKPEVDDDTGLITYEDIAGNEHAINRDQIIQMIEK
ncbi:YgdI/YgdR family lipoprotein [Klebsiella quasipneumoniae]|uniref:YgdI/YgdR family lipoprotein n=1 Tax=Klebsiella quasipneumoniae TaxID=1463165 RepID=UPI003890D684